MTALTTWTHPTTGELRLYVRHPALGPNDKLFLIEGTAGEWRAVLRGDGLRALCRMFGSVEDAAGNMAHEAVGSNNWADALAKAAA